MLYIVTAGFMLFDIISGLIGAFKEKCYTSSIMRQGLFHKCGSILLIIFGVLIEYAQTLIDIGVNIPLVSFICGYIIIMEIGSIIENIGKINPDFKNTKISTYFSKLTKDGEN